MTTDYIHTVAVAAPRALLADVNELALVMGESAYDDRSFKPPFFRASDSSEHAFQFTRVRPSFVAKISQTDPLAPPGHSPGADMTRAEAARAAMSTTGPARAGVMVVLVDLTPEQAWQAMALDEIEEPDQGAININSADKATLETLDGVGSVTADKIVQGRPWSRAFDLTAIDTVTAMKVSEWMADPGLET